MEKTKEKHIDKKKKKKGGRERGSVPEITDYSEINRTPIYFIKNSKSWRKEDRVRSEDPHHG